MDPLEGMLAVVRKMPDASLTMSVLDGKQQYTLVPKSKAATSTSMAPVTSYVPVPVHSVGTEPCFETQNTMLNHGAQAVDGRYASVYQTTHCHVQPTSPPVQVTEFPPQRAEISRGQCNFEVGGIGSGETNGSPTRSTLSYRGGLTWPDRAVYSPRQTYEPDLFADSLRKYPSMSGERSAEVVERLVNYSHLRNSCKSLPRGSMSPSRSEASPGQIMDRRSCISASLRTSKTYELDFNAKRKAGEESPTRDTSKKVDYEDIELRRTLFGRNYDVRHFRDFTRRARESIKTGYTYPYSHTVCPAMKERYDHSPPKNKFLEIINSANMETQAEVPMASKEVTTVPREQPITRNVAVPLSPSSSISNSAKPSHHKIQSTSTHISKVLKTKISSKSIQTITLRNLTVKPIKSVQTCASSIDIVNKKKVKTCRQTKSQEELSTNNEFEEELLQAIKDLNVRSDVDARFSGRNGLRKFRKIYRTERNDKVKIKLGKCVRDQLYSHLDMKNFTHELSNKLISQIQASNIFLRCYGPTNALKPEVLRTENDDNYVNELIKKWLDDIPIKHVDYLGRAVDKEHVLLIVASKIKRLIIDKVHLDRCGSLKAELLNILEDIPVDIKQNKNCFLDRLTTDLTRKIKNVFTFDSTERTKWQEAIDLDKALKYEVKKENSAFTNVLPSYNELKNFVERELLHFRTKFNITICAATEREIQIELVDILIDSLSILRYGDDEKVKEDILIMVSDYIKLSENEGLYFVNNLVYKFKYLLKDNQTDDISSHPFTVVQNSVQNTSNQTSNTAGDMAHNDDKISVITYTQQIIEQILQWIESKRELNNLEGGVKKDIAQDLARDIVDRRNYLILNSNIKRSYSDELEHLQYQIFKKIKNVVGEDTFEIVRHASELIDRIQNLQDPSPTRPAVTVMNAEVAQTSCCNKDDTKNSNRERSNSAQFSLRSEKNCGRKKSSISYAFSNERTQTEQNKCCETSKLNDLGVMTDQNQDGILNETTGRPSEHSQYKKTSFTETDMARIPVTCPRGTSMTITERISSNRRFSDLRNNQPASQITSTSRRDSQSCSTNPQNLGSYNSSRPLCCAIEPKDPTAKIKQLNDEYDRYLQNWVTQIPIITSNPDEQNLINKMQKSIYNGVWKARTQLQMDLNALDNRFYFQDLLDDELEELLNLLPQSCELMRKKQMLKNELIEKTLKNIEDIQIASASPSYKQQLIDNVGNHIPRKLVGFTSSDLGKICEDIHKLNIAETFIMCTMYKEKDGVKANVYKKKLMKQIQEFFDNMKRTQGIEAKDLDIKTYKDEILKALYEVPQPSDDTIREEGNEVLIGLEIEQWFSDLPLHATENNFEILCRKRYRDTLAKKVHDLEKQKELTNCEDELRHEITKFMSKLPLREDEIKNIPFMVEELINRLKNRPQDLVEGSSKRKFMPLIDPYDYDEFSRDMPQCSSFTNAPGTRRAQINESSYYVRDGERIEDPYEIAGQFERVNIVRENLETNQGSPCCNKDSTPQPRQSFQNPDSEQWQSMHPDTQQPPSGMFEQASHENISDCCQIPDDQYNADNLSTPCNCSAREPEIRLKEETIEQDTDPTITTGGRHSTSLDRHSSGPAVQPNFYTPGPQVPTGRSSPYDRRSSGPSGNIPGNVNRGEYLQVPVNKFENCCNKYKGAQDSQQFPMEEGQSCHCSLQESCSQFYNNQQPGTSQDQSSPRQSPSCFSKEPVGYSTPQTGGPPPRMSRPKKRSRPADKTGRETAKKKLDMTDSDESCEEVQCRCMERFWSRRRKRFGPCDECEFPPCFPLRFPYPYYF